MLEGRQETTVNLENACILRHLKRLIAIGVMQSNGAWILIEASESAASLHPIPSATSCLPMLRDTYKGKPLFFIQSEFASEILKGKFCALAGK